MMRRWGYDQSRCGLRIGAVTPAGQSLGANMGNQGSCPTRTSPAAPKARVRAEGVPERIDCEHGGALLIQAHSPQQRRQPERRPSNAKGLLARISIQLPLKAPFQPLDGDRTAEEYRGLTRLLPRVRETDQGLPRRMELARFHDGRSREERTSLPFPIGGRVTKGGQSAGSVQEAAGGNDAVSGR